MRLRHTPFSPACRPYRRPRCGAVDKDVPWYHFVYDERWRIVAVYRADTTTGDLDDDPKEQFIYHAAGLDGYGSGSYTDAVILRDRDANATGGWAGEADGTLEERRYYAQNWRHDVVAIVTDAGVMTEQVRYSAYGVPFGLPQGDVDGDGTVDNDDRAIINAAMDESVGDPGYDVRADLDLDGTVTTADLNTWNANNATTLGWDSLSEDPDDGVGNRIGYAGYQHDPALAASWTLYHVRHRVYNADLGRWTRRDPLGYVDGMSLYEYVRSRALVAVDPQGRRMHIRVTGVSWSYEECNSASCTWEFRIDNFPADEDPDDYVLIQKVHAKVVCHDCKERNSRPSSVTYYEAIPCKREGDRGTTLICDRDTGGGHVRDHRGWFSQSGELRFYRKEDLPTINDEAEPDTWQKDPHTTSSGSCAGYSVSSGSFKSSKRFRGWRITKPQAVLRKARNISFDWHCDCNCSPDQSGFSCTPKQE